MAEDYLNQAKKEWDRRAEADPIGYTSAAESREQYEERGTRDTKIMVDLLKEAGAKWETGLELGCGTGRLLKPLQEHFKTLHGCDISDKMLDVARKDVPGIEFHLIEGTKLPVSNVNVIICHSVFHHVPRTVFREYVTTIHEALADGGIFLFQLTKPYSLRRKVKAWLRSEPGPEEAWLSRYYTWGELRSMAKGFRVVKERTDELNMISVWAKA